ncbi:hypothetical protein Glove_102g68 [Diversispora epigaea]|uniref:Transposase domain-containing protein n=1 Tax=Diversispora epigaea TaxID=1348612 RepID=A0A397JAE1_9GLOM|nr:hypothetical protein Glove_102g68 [Diversispora epigaea]
MNEFQVSANLGRIPGKIYCGEGFSNFTADQWRIFISIYATIVLWEYLEKVDRKILTYFVRICHLFVNRILETKSLDEIHKKIVDVITLIEKKYGRNVITPNLHLSLHLSTCSHDFGLLYAFWYFSFERINGILGSLPNSHRQIEPELMRRLINDNRINEMIYTENNTKGLEILNTRQSVGSLSEIDQFGHDEMRRFWMYSRTIQESTISGKELFPDEMLKPFSKNIPLSADGILDLMIVYYNDTYENLKFRKPFKTDSLNSIIIPLKINKYCHCRIGSEIFGSTFSSRHQKSSYILAKFASEDDSIDIYLGQIQFFFVHEISTNRINMENYYLAYVLHHILGRFVPVKYKISDRKNAKEHQKSSYILAKFASEDDSIDIYLGQIQFFFVHEISTNRINMENYYLAYVRWYKKIKNRFYFGINQEQMCNVELWDTEFYPKS